MKSNKSKKFFCEIAFLAFLKLQKMEYLVKKFFREIDLFDYTSFLNFLAHCALVDPDAVKLLLLMVRKMLMLFASVLQLSKKAFFLFLWAKFFFLSPLLWAMKLYILIFFWSVSGKTRISFDTFQFFLEEVDDTIK